MMKHKVGTKFSREYKGKTVTVKVTKNGYAFGKKNYDSLTAAVRDGIGTTSPASVFFKLAGKSAKAGKRRKPKSQATETHSPLAGMIREMVQSVVKEEISKAVSSVREEVQTEIQSALAEGFSNGEAN